MAEIPSSDITDKRFYLNRRAFLASALATVGASAIANPELHAQQPAARGRKLVTVKSPLSGTDTPNTWEHVTTYNNFYEFGTSKSDPALNARGFKPPEPWTIEIEGECARRGRITLEDVLKGQALEDRVYRHRCVEGWSMVIPWTGFPLASLIKRCEPTSKAAFVEFTTLLDRRQMPGLDSDVIDWPYVEGLRLDEAMHPLTILAVGLYGEVLPGQNGAPLRLVVPWKYGFKGIKSIVKVRFLASQPVTSWQRNWPQAYGFYANVNPAVAHPRHSQAIEARLPSMFRTMKTLPFNGYGDQVASLYSGMDLRRNY